MVGPSRIRSTEKDANHSLPPTPPLSFFPLHAWQWPLLRGGFNQMLPHEIVAVFVSTLLAFEAY